MAVSRNEFAEPPKTISGKSRMVDLWQREAAAEPAIGRIALTEADVPDLAN